MPRGRIKGFKHSQATKDKMAESHKKKKEAVEKKEEKKE